MSIRNHVFVSGKVQGVGFRASTMNKASELGISGWVRNLDDGRVEAVFEGSPEDVDRIVEWCKRGPETASVDNLKVNEEEPRNLTVFEIKY